MKLVTIVFKSEVNYINKRLQKILVNFFSIIIAHLFVFLIYCNLRKIINFYINKIEFK